VVGEWSVSLFVERRCLLEQVLVRGSLKLVAAGRLVHESLENDVEVEAKLVIVRGEWLDEVTCLPLVLASQVLVMLAGYANENTVLGEISEVDSQGV